MNTLARLLFPRRLYVLRTTLSPAEALDRLRERLEAQRSHGFEWLTGWLHPRVRGKVSDQGFTLTLPNWWWHHQAPYWRLQGSFNTDTRETRVDLRLSPHPISFLLTTALPALLFLPVIFVFGLHPLAGLVAWALIVAFFAAVFRLFPLADNLLKESEDERLLRFMREALDAELVPVQ